jgi:hypothetical protein
MITDNLLRIVLLEFDIDHLDFFQGRSFYFRVAEIQQRKHTNLHGKGGSYPFLYYFQLLANSPHAQFDVLLRGTSIDMVKIQAKHVEEPNNRKP